MDMGLVLIALASAFCFALALVLTQFGLRTTKPMNGAAIAVPTTAVLFVLISPFTVPWDMWHGRSVMIFAAVGLFFPVAVTLLTFSANRIIGPNLTGTLGNLTPLFAVALAVALLDEVPRIAQMAGIAAICAGVAMLFAGRGHGDMRPALWAWALPLGAALLRGVVQPLVKLGLDAWPSPFAAATIGYVVSAMVLGGVVITARGRWETPPRAGVAWFVAVGAVNGAAVLLLYMALDRGPVIIVAPLVACYPLITLILNRICLGQGSVSGLAVGGIFITVAGVGLLLRS